MGLVENRREAGRIPDTQLTLQTTRWYHRTLLRLNLNFIRGLGSGPVVHPMSAFDQSQPLL